MERKRIPYRAHHFGRYFACCVTRRSLDEIGRGTGGVTATNVLMDQRKIEREMAENPVFAAEVAALKASLLANN